MKTENKINGYAVIPKGAFSFGWESDTKKEHKTKCKGGCSCDPNEWWTKIYYTREGAMKHKNQWNKIVKITLTP